MFCLFYQSKQPNLLHDNYSPRLGTLHCRGSLLAGPQVVYRTLKPFRKRSKRGIGRGVSTLGKPSWPVREIKIPPSPWCVSLGSFKNPTSLTISARTTEHELDRVPPVGLVNASEYNILANNLGGGTTTTSE